MELKTQQLKQNTIKSKAFTQVTLDDDCIVRDSKPDIIKIIHTKGNVAFEETKISNQTVWVTGKLTFTVLYRSDATGNKLETMTDSVNFGEKIFMEEVEELDTVRLSGKLEDLSINAINSRKLAVRAVIGIQAVCEQLEEQELIREVEDANVQQQSRTQPMLLLVTSKRDILRMHHEMALPGASPNIGKVIYYNVDVRNKEITLAGNRIQLHAEAYVNVLYDSAEGQLEWFETMVPVTESMDCEVDTQQPLYWITATPMETTLEASEDYDGEMRTFQMDQVFDIDIKVWKEEEVKMLSDVYSLKETLIPHTMPIKSLSLMMKNEAKQRISQQMRLADGKERILQLCSYEGSVDLDRVDMVENGLRAEGVLSVHILYATADDGFPVAHCFEQIPFTQVIDVPELTANMQNCTYEIDPGIDQLQVNLLDNERYEIKATVSLTALAFRENYAGHIVSIDTEPLNDAEMEAQPGITGYIVQPEDTLWNIAKRYHTTEQMIIGTNALKTSQVQPGEKLMIVKSMGE
jgi:LysM repeat protein